MGILPIALFVASLIPSLFKKKAPATKSKEESKTTTTQPRLGYQSPFLGLLDAQMAEMITQLMGNMGGAGMPGGIGFMSPNNGGFLSAIRSALPGLFAGYGGQGAAMFGGGDIDKEIAEKEQDMQRGGGEPAPRPSVGKEVQREGGRKGFPPRLRQA